MPRNVVLHMGFINTPYSNAAIAAPVRAAKAEFARKQRRGFTSTMTAEDVADILEDKYSIMDVFQQIHGEEIADMMAESFENVVVDLFAEKTRFSSEKMVKYMKPKTDQIEKLFKSFLNNEEMNGELTNEIKATSGKTRKTRRAGPPFIDTGIYRASFKAWVDIK